MSLSRLLFFLVLLIFTFGAGQAQTVKESFYRNRFISSLDSPTAVKQTGERSWFIDFGLDAFGTLSLRLGYPQPDTLIIHLGEKISGPEKIDRNPGGTIRYQKIRLPVSPGTKEYTVNLPADKRNTSPPAVPLPDSIGVIMPFRYCEIENYSGKLTANNIRRKSFTWDFNDDAASFTSSDTILNKIWDLCKYSIKATSFCGLYVDGDRERIPYEADAYINQLSHYSVDNEYSLARRTNEYFIENPTWPTEWILSTILLFYNDYMYTGNPEPLIKNYEALKAKTLIGLEREDGLISSKSEKLTDEFMGSLGFRDRKQRIRDIVDWPPAQKDTGWKLSTPEGERDGYDMVPVNTVVNSYHFMNLKLMSEIAGWLRKKEDSIFFLKRSLQVKESINSRLFDKKLGIYLDGENSSHSSLHANMFPLAFGLVPEEYRKSVVAFIKSRGMACSVYGAQFLLEGLYSVNESDYAYSLLTSTSDRSWWNMIRSGSTITLEAWDMKYKPNSDWNHAWGAAPANIISRNLWGITPSAPGYSEVQVKPLPGKLISSRIKVPTIKGPVIAEYKALAGKQSGFSVELPSGMKGKFILPPGPYREVQLNGKKIIPEHNTVLLIPGINRITF
jgi:alpha-L-rhamnosidase